LNRITLKVIDERFSKKPKKKEDVIARNEAIANYTERPSLSGIASQWSWFL